MQSEILVGCSEIRGIILAIKSGFCRINSADATINDRLLRTSWLMLDSLRLIQIKQPG